MDLLRKRPFRAQAIGHFTLDMFASSVAVILTFFSVPLGFTNAQIGLTASVFSFVSSLPQPLFGWVAGRFGSRWLGAGGLLWIMTFMSLAVLVGQQGNVPLFVAALLLAGLGSAAFHPQGAMNATNVDEKQQTTAASIFFFFGAMGVTIGPAMTGILLQHTGTNGYPLLMVLGLPAVWWLATSKPISSQDSQTSEGQAVVGRTRAKHGTVVLAAMIGLIVLRSWADAAIMTFLPKFYQDRGWDATSYGLAAAVLALGMAAGIALGGPAADRWGRRLIMSISFIASVPFLILLPYAPGAASVAVSAVVGILFGLSFSATIVLAQTLLPGNKGTATGLVMGLRFASGALGMVLTGWIADATSLNFALQSLAIVALGAGLCAWVLPATRTAAVQEQAAPN